jgi:hypothetical protein
MYDQGICRAEVNGNLLRKKIKKAQCAMYLLG